MSKDNTDGFFSSEELEKFYWENRKYEKPSACGPGESRVPAELKSYDQWVVWRFVWSEKADNWVREFFDAKNRLFKKVAYTLGTPGV